MRNVRTEFSFSASRSIYALTAILSPRVLGHTHMYHQSLTVNSLTSSMWTGLATSIGKTLSGLSPTHAQPQAHRTVIRSPREAVPSSVPRYYRRRLCPYPIFLAVGFGAAHVEIATLGKEFYGLPVHFGAGWGISHHGSRAGAVDLSRLMLSHLTSISQLISKCTRMEGHCTRAVACLSAESVSLDFPDR